MRRLGALALLVLLGASWGLHVVLSKALGAETTVQALAYLTLYMIGASIGLVAAQLAVARRFRPTASHLRFFVIAAFFGYVAPLFLEMVIAPKIDVALFTLIAALVPAITVAFVAAIGAERVTGRRLVALALGVAATAILLAPGAAMPLEERTIWVAAAFLVPAAYAFDNVYIAWAWPQDLDVVQVSAAESVAGLGLVTAMALSMGVDGAVLVEATRTGGGWLPALVGVSIASTWLYFHLIRTAGAVFVSFAGFVSVATGVISGIVFFGERPGLGLWVACALTVGSLWLLRERRVGAVA